VTKLRRRKWVVHVVGIGERREAYRVFVEEAEGKRPIGRLRYRCVVTRLQKNPMLHHTMSLHFTVVWCYECNWY
jgi:hypothetical protein